MPFDFKKHMEWAESIAIVSRLGFTMAGSIVLCFFVGLYLDRWMGTRGVLLTLFILLGVFGGAATVYRRILDITTEQPDDRKTPDDSIG